MAFRLNIFTGQLDLVNPSSSGGSGNVTGVPPTDINAIARWDDTTGTTIKNSKAFVQDGGAVEAQAYLTNRVIEESVLIKSNFTMLAANIEIEDGEIVIEQDGELLIL